MALHQNGFRDNCGVFRFAGAAVSNGAYPSTLPINTHLTGAQRNITAGDGIADDMVGIPLGYLVGGAWVLPQKPGNLSARYTSTISMAATGTAYGGITSGAATSITFAIADAAGQLISSGAGAATFTVSAAPLVMTASISGGGAAVVSIVANAPTISAIASVMGTASVTLSGSLAPYAIGNMVGSTIDASTLSAEAIIAAMNANPPAVNIKKVNDYAVTGTGQPGTEWGP